MTRGLRAADYRRPVRTVFAALAMALAALAVGCGGERQDPRAPEPTSPTETLPKAEPTVLTGPRPDLRQTGSLGWALLRDDVPNVVLEVDSAPGVRLSDRAVVALERHLGEHGGKDVEVERHERLPAQDVYDAQTLVELTREHRSATSSVDTVVIHVLTLPGRFEQEGAMGVSFLSTAFAVFVDAIAETLPPSASGPEYEAAVASHELGHLFGLVNLTGVGGFHEDDNHPGHSTNGDSVMHGAVEVSPLALGGSPPTVFDDDDRREIERIREQRP